MKYKRDAIQAYLRTRTTPILHQRFRDGLSEHVSDDPAWSGGDSDWEQSTIYGLKNDGGSSGWDRTILTREEYPELYVFKDETIRLQKLMDEQASMSPR
jgi:hypothetical protein